MIKDILALVEEIKNSIKEQTDLAVVGLSGGADSTLVAILCKEALGPDNVIGIHMPYGETDESFFNARSRKLADKLGIKQLNIPITTIANNITELVRMAVHPTPTTIDGEKESWVDLNVVNLGNARSRARMCVLYAVAHELGNFKRARVMGTGNMSEDYIFYDTKFGDSGCDNFIIGELFKSEVYQLLDYFKDKGIITEEHIDRKPSAGLWNNQTDEQELGYSYDEMEPVIKEKISSIPGYTYDKTEIGMFVKKRHETGKHKHEPAPVTKVRRYCD